MKRKTVTIPIINDEYKVIVCWGDKAYTRRVGRDWGYSKDARIELSDENRGITYYIAGCHPIIVLPGPPNTPEEIGTLSHEAVHSIDYVFDHLGEDVKSSHEVFAHSVGAVVRKVLKAIQ